MLRRVARVLRVSLALGGLLLLAWMPVSFFFYSGASLSWLRTAVSSGGGGVRITFFHELPSDFVWPTAFAYFERVESDRRDWHEALLLPQVADQRAVGMAYLNLSFPLWLLAAVCLAWPVTSFLVRRRRRGRGFEVEAKDGGAVSTADS